MEHQVNVGPMETDGAAARCAGASRGVPSRAMGQVRVRSEGRSPGRCSSTRRGMSRKIASSSAFASRSTGIATNRAPRRRRARNALQTAKALCRADHFIFNAPTSTFTASGSMLTFLSGREGEERNEHSRITWRHRKVAVRQPRPRQAPRDERDRIYGAASHQVRPQNLFEAQFSIV